MLHPDVANAIEQIDAAFFSGDQFQDDVNRDIIIHYLKRWTNETMRITKQQLEELTEGG